MYYIVVPQVGILIFDLSFILYYNS